MTPVTILHLTDLHFGCDSSKLDGAKRTLCLDSLVKTVAVLEREWRPKVLCVTGDIGWHGIKTDYDLAKAWLEQLLKDLKLKFRDTVVCAGNHDIDRAIARTIARPADAGDADTLLAPPLGTQYTSAFAAFTDFCKDNGVHPYTFQGNESYLLGETTLHGVRFVALNSAWFCKGNDDRNRLWVGLPHLQILESDGQLHLVTRTAGPPTVALVHHPPGWWNEAETNAYGMRPNTCDYLAHRAHLILTGHTHGEVRPADRIAEAALHLTGGSAYADAGYFNSFRLTRVEEDHLVYRSFEFDPRSPEHAWADKGGARSVPFAERPPDRTQVAVPELAAEDLAEHRNAAIADARRILEQKSRQVKPRGPLPEPIQLLVAARISSHQDRYDATGRLRTEPREIHLLPLVEVAQFARRTVLLGDLGSGKSTLAARHVIETIERSEGSLAFLIPARSLQLPAPCTVRDVLTACSRYFRDQVAPHARPVDLQDLLSRKVDISLVIDGLDEVSQEVAALLLRQLATLTDCWPSAQLLVTGRPIELAGVSYESWGQCFIEPLTDEAREALFRSEAACEGQGAGAAEETARERIHALKRQPLLDQVARTVLAARLLYPKLSGAGPANDQSVGDLLAGLLMDRLGMWPAADLKPCPFVRFEEAFPTPLQRAELLGELALTFKDATALPRPAAVQALLPHAGNEYSVAEEALGYFEGAGLLNITASDAVEFVFQPLREVAAGAAILARWLRDGAEAPMLVTGWRAQSFAAGQAFRRGVLARVRPRLADILCRLLGEPFGVPAACMVASEARDADTAQVVVRGLRNLGRKPLRTFHDEQFASNHAIAKTLHLAGESGFDWLFEEYLDPRYPIVHRGSAIIERVFHHWAWIAGRALTHTQRTRLRSLVRPLLAVPALFSMLPSLSFLVPEEFSEQERLWHQAAHLDDDLFGPWAVEEMTRVAEKLPDLVRDVLRRRSVNLRSAALLYLRLFAGTPIPPDTLCGVIRWWGAAPDSQTCREAVSRCEHALGPQIWQQFIRWCLTDPERGVAAGAALLLHQAGERRMPVLDDVLLDALHDGGYVPRAEEVLGSLLDDDRPRAVRWLSGKIASYKEMYGAHSGWWRLLFRILDPAAPDSPSVLAGCVGGIGPFLLARHAAVRAGFRGLLQDAHGGRFRETLQRLLDHPEPVIRHGAASVLLFCDPAVSTDALLTVVATRSELPGHYHEWERFCLTLSIGPTLLAALHGSLGTVDKAGRALALAILHRNGYNLTPREREELYGALLEVGNWSLCPAVEDRQGRAAETWIRFLERQVEREGGERAQRAADHLLLRFGNLLSGEQRSRCCRLAAQAPHSSPADLEEQLARVLLEGPPEAPAGVPVSTGETPRSPGVLDLVAETKRNPARWKDVVWALCCQQGFGMETEDGGEVLLHIGRDDPTAGQHIGSAALALVDDVRLVERQVDARHWLALLASEFGSLPTERIRQVLSGAQPIFGSATRALIARLREVPADMMRRPTVVDTPLDLGRLAPVLSAETLLSRLVECGRDAAAIHPDTCGLIECTLCTVAMEEDQVARVAEQGRVGAAIALTLRFCAGLPHSLSDWMSLLEDGMLFWDRQSPCWGRVARNGHMAHDAALNGSTALRQHYCQLLDGALLTGTDRFGVYAMELLRWQKGFTASQVGPIFEALAGGCTAANQRTWDSLVPWVAALEAGPLESAVADAAEHGVLVLNGRGFPKEPGERLAEPAILFPLAIWALKGTCSPESISVYWYGLRLLFMGAATWGGPARVRHLFDALAPLVQKVSPGIWVQVRRVPPIFSDPGLSTMLRVFASLGGDCAMATNTPN
jgi:hypothetical protein